MTPDSNDKRARRATSKLQPPQAPTSGDPHAQCGEPKMAATPPKKAK